MKRRMIWIFLAGALVGIVLSGLYKHFVTDQIMDGGNGMENPDQNLFLLDGDGTYVDNSLLWPVLEGTWESPEDGWQAVISEEDGLTLRLDGETVLETPLDFTYIPRKKIQDTGLMLDNRVLQKADGTEWGKILDVYHCAGAGERWELLKNGAPVCVTAVSTATLLPNQFTTAYRSAMFRGRAQVVTDEGEKMKAMLLLCTAFDPKGMGRFDQAMAHCPAQVIKIVPEVITGKEHEMHQEPPKAHTCHS